MSDASFPRCLVFIWWLYAKLVSSCYVVVDTSPVHQSAGTDIFTPYEMAMDAQSIFLTDFRDILTKWVMERSLISLFIVVRICASTNFRSLSYRLRLRSSTRCLRPFIGQWHFHPRRPGLETLERALTKTICSNTVSESRPLPGACR